LPASEVLSSAHGDGAVLRVSGAVPADGAAATGIEVMHGQWLIHTAQILRDRERVSFDTLVALFGLPERYELTLRAVLADGSRLPFATIAGRREPIRTLYEPRLRPLMVTSPGRSGTTWVMSLFDAHQRVVVEGRYPYEQWPGRYFAHLLTVLGSPSRFQRPPPEFDDGAAFVQRNPFNSLQELEANSGLATWFSGRYLERLATLCQESIDSWYSCVARERGLEQPLYFAEKQLHRPTVVPTLLWELYPAAREVFMVRDFRDLAISKIAWTRKTGGKVEDGDEHFVRHFLGPRVRAFHDAWRMRGEQAHLIRYEDLVTSPQEILAGMLDYLELDSAPATVASLLQSAPVPEFHRTSPSAGQSIGRWRRDADSSLQAVFDEVLGEALRSFGYE
jgi:hypothetical protein